MAIEIARTCLCVCVRMSAWDHVTSQIHKKETRWATDVGWADRENGEEKWHRGKGGKVTCKKTCV